MNKCVIFGAGSKTRLCIREILRDYKVLCITDNDSNNWGKTIEDVKILPPAEALKSDFDFIVMCNMTAAVTYAWLKQLSDMGIGRDKLIFDYCVYNVDAREEFLKSLAAMLYDKHIQGSTAEAGVYKGEFSKHINACFPDRKLYLFDTFEGFSRKDAEYESFDMQELIGRFGDTSEAFVLEKMTHPDNCIFRKGIFPDSTSGIEDSFCFVNLDMDLYYPTISGLEFFCRRLEKGGVVLVHDYFSGFFSGVKRAVDEWRESNPGFACIPIGDGLSVALTGL